MPRITDSYGSSLIHWQKEEKWNNLHYLIYSIGTVRIKLDTLHNSRRVGKGEFHSQASHRTVRDSLPSYGSCYSWYASTVAHFPVIKQLRVRLLYQIEFCHLPGFTQLALFYIREYSFVNLSSLLFLFFSFSFFCKVVVVNIPLNNLSPSLLFAFAKYHHYYGLVRLPFHAFFSRYPETDIPCSIIKPNFKSCRLYNGGRIASKQVSAMLISTSLAQCDFALQLMRFRYFFSDSFAFIS